MSNHLYFLKFNISRTVYSPFKGVNSGEILEFWPYRRNPEWFCKNYIEINYESEKKSICQMIAIVFYILYLLCEGNELKPEIKNKNKIQIKI